MYLYCSSRVFDAQTPRIQHPRNVTQAAEDVASTGTPTFAALTIRGSFHSGDIVLPMLAAEDGAPMGKHVEVTESGRGMKITRPHQVTQAQLYLNTHEPDEIF